MLVAGALCGSVITAGAFVGSAAAYEEKPKFVYRMLEIERCEMQTIEDEDIVIRYPVRLPPPPPESGGAGSGCTEEDNRAVNNCLGSGGRVTLVSNRPACWVPREAVRATGISAANGCLRSGGSWAAAGERLICIATPAEVRRALAAVRPVERETRTAAPRRREF
jgi:hypothetical protein